MDIHARHDAPDAPRGGSLAAQGSGEPEPELPGLQVAGNLTGSCGHLQHFPGEDLLGLHWQLTANSTR